jgi:hypothetical protein
MKEPFNSEISTTSAQSSNLEELSSLPENLEGMKLNEPGVILYFLDGTIQACNTCAEEILGLKFEEMGRWTSREAIHQDGSPFSDESHPVAVTLDTGKSCTNVVMGVYRSSGELIWMRVDTQPLHQGKPSITWGLIVTFWEITELEPKFERTHPQRQDDGYLKAALKASEAKLKTFVDSNVIGVVLSDVHGGIHEANDKFLEMVGYSREDLNTGQMRWSEMTPPDFLHRDERHIAEAQLYGACTPYEKEYFHQDGRRIPVLIGYALVGETREEAVAFIIDLTERKRIEAERDRFLAQEKAARAEAEQANRIKDEFLAVLSHELRTPLNPILGWSKLLQSGRLDPTKAATAYTVIERNARLQAQLIEDLLDVSRILQGKLTLNISQVEPKIVILEALDTIRLAAEAKGIEIETYLNDNVGSVLGDPSRLQQVVWNLLSNAVKFTHQGGKVMVKLTQHDSYIQIQVSDTGKGISPDFLPYVFDYFRQADSGTTRKFGGLGLGLAIVKQIVELHGGTITAESLGEEQGATFTAILPQQKPETGTSMVQSHLSSSPKVNLAAFLLANVHILVVDDDADSRDLIASILEQEGAQIISVASGLEALETLAKSPFDVLIADIGMPDLDGYLLLRQIRALPPEKGGKIPAIALTAYAGEYDRKKAIAAGFQQHLAKPIEPHQLIDIVMRLKLN